MKQESKDHKLNNWNFVKSYKGMFWYKFEETIFIVSSDYHREEWLAEYSYDQFLYGMICDDDIIITEESK